MQDFGVNSVSGQDKQIELAGTAAGRHHMIAAELYMTHCLVVGGTGMLRGVSLALAQRWGMVSVVARTPARLESLVAAAIDRINPIAVDWRHDDSLRRSLSSAVQRHGPITLALCWIHSNAPEAPFIVADAVANEDSPCRYIQIFGSRDDAAMPIKQHWQEGLLQRKGIRYRRIVLGSAANGEQRRWLTDEEICAGVLRAIDLANELTIVGEADYSTLFESS